MAGDLEDFLRRAAQRRAETAGARPKPPQQQPPRRPEYTDRNRERSMSTKDVDEEVVIADIVPPAVEAARNVRVRTASTPPHSESRPKILLEPAPVKAPRAPHVASQVTENPDVAASATVQALLRLMTDPNGIRQAILAREILDPPHHRW